MTALTVSHQIAAPLEVIPQDLGITAQNLTTAAKVLEVTDQATFDAANRILVDLHATAKAVEARRVALKRPLADLGKQIEAVVSGVADPMDAAKRTLQGRVMAYQKAEQAKSDALRREAEEKARVEREAAEKERARLQAEADAKHAAEVAAAKAKAEAEAKELAAILGKPVEAEPVKVAPAPVIVAAPVIAPVAVAPPLPKAAVQTVTVPTLVVADAGVLAAWLVANSRAHLVEFKMREIKALHEAGVPVPGLAIEQREQVRMAGGRP